MRQIDLLLAKTDLDALNCELSVKIHAWLMRHVSAECSAYMHKSNELRPFSLFTRVQHNNIALRLSLLSSEAEPVAEALWAAKDLAISGLNRSIVVIDKIEKPAVPLAQLYRSSPNEFRFILASPASYKHNGRISNIYSLAQLLIPVAAKLRRFEGVDITDEEVAELCGMATHTQYELRSAVYKIKPGITRPGFWGDLTLQPEGSPEKRRKLSLLLRYAAYSGVGAKTAMGMGGVLMFEV